VKRPLARLAVQIGPRITHHDPADKADQQRHGDTDRVKPKRQQPCPRAEGNRRLTLDQKLADTGQGQAEAGKGSGLGETWQLAGPDGRAGRGDGGHSQQQNRCNQGKGKRQRHRAGSRSRGMAIQIPLAGLPENYILYQKSFY
jgi:hypothetical protein